MLTSLELPLGPEFVPDMRSVQRAQQQDLGQMTRYQVAFVQVWRRGVIGRCVIRCTVRLRGALLLA